MIKVGQRYEKTKWIVGDHLSKDLKNRIFEVKSKTLTHVYIHNLRLGYSVNVSINEFKKAYTLR